MDHTTSPANFSSLRKQTFVFFYIRLWLRFFPAEVSAGLPPLSGAFDQRYCWLATQEFPIDVYAGVSPQAMCILPLASIAILNWSP